LIESDCWLGPPQAEDILLGKIAKLLMTTLLTVVFVTFFVEPTDEKAERLFNFFFFFSSSELIFSYFLSSYRSCAFVW